MSIRRSILVRVTHARCFLTHDLQVQTPLVEPYLCVMWPRFMSSPRFLLQDDVCQMESGMNFSVSPNLSLWLVRPRRRRRVEADGASVLPSEAGDLLHRSQRRVVLREEPRRAVGLQPQRRHRREDPGGHGLRPARVSRVTSPRQAAGSVLRVLVTRRGRHCVLTVATVSSRSPVSLSGLLCGTTWEWNSRSTFPARITRARSPCASSSQTAAATATPQSPTGRPRPAPALYRAAAGSGVCVCVCVLTFFILFLNLLKTLFSTFSNFFLKLFLTSVLPIFNLFLNLFIHFFTCF